MNNYKFFISVCLMAILLSCSGNFEPISPESRAGVSSSSLASSSSSEEPSSSSTNENKSSSTEQSYSSSNCADFNDGKREHYGQDKEQFCDERDDNRYVFVEINNQTWMAENLNYAVTGSICPANDENNCNIYGRLYDWETANKICPSGWHLPEKKELDTLIQYITSYFDITEVGKHLKATSRWEGNNGDDDFGFSALPAGNSFVDSVGTYGFWWNSDLSTENETEAYIYAMLGLYSYIAQARTSIEETKNSVRCIKDGAK